MIIVLDSNEYIQYFERSLEILDEILTNEEISIYINEIIKSPLCAVFFQGKNKKNKNTHTSTKR